VAHLAAFFCFFFFCFFFCFFFFFFLFLLFIFFFFCFFFFFFSLLKAAGENSASHVTPFTHFSGGFTRVVRSADYAGGHSRHRVDATIIGRLAAAGHNYGSPARRRLPPGRLELASFGRKLSGMMVDASHCNTVG